MEKKYELTDETMEWEGHTLHRIRALKDFDDIKKGTLGGWIESEQNLSQEGNCWVFEDTSVRAEDNSAVYGNARVYGNAYVSGSSTIKDNAVICDCAEVCDSVVCDNAVIEDNGFVSSHSLVGKNGRVSDDGGVTSGSIIYGTVKDMASVYSESVIEEGAIVCEEADVNHSNIAANKTVSGREQYIDSSLWSW